MLEKSDVGKEVSEKGKVVLGKNEFGKGDIGKGLLLEKRLLSDTKNNDISKAMVTPNATTTSKQQFNR
ncbi:6193_t:CDS:2 [Dentiscutata erythropus]|uniref:6193_t:CDS:1 n=1 Tax=Dentiscutata erythropus TaxID=1348616 RepID=A0A9N9IFG9_9GLOM|nr:6193_t:CDS:2 [Dentiscutata erythropus]